MALQAVLFDEKRSFREELRPKYPVKNRRLGKHKGRLLATQTEAAFYVGSGENYGILCRRFEGWYIKSIMAYLKQSGINAVYEKMHEKGLGFQGYLIKRK